jgi:glycosyltransferase involved in cell wall biosynthesis
MSTEIFGKVAVRIRRRLYGRASSIRCDAPCGATSPGGLDRRLPLHQRSSGCYRRVALEAGAPAVNIAFYATMKPPDDPEPSGDRQMAGLLIKALRKAGHDVRLASRLRTFHREPDDAVRRRLKGQALDETEALCTFWSSPKANWRPTAWFTYHPYYKAPDWLGPEVCSRLAIPYVTAEASYAPRRDGGPWGVWQLDVVDALRRAAANFCFTARDKAELLRIAGLKGQLVDLPPFIDTEDECPAPEPRVHQDPPRLVTVAMMRSGNKLASYRVLANALVELLAKQWTLNVIGDGPEREAVRHAFSGIPPERIDWLGELRPEQVTDHLAGCDIYVWPGVGEAYGLAYLEAQAAGLPVVAQETGGIRAVVKAGETGCLTPVGDVPAFAEALRQLLIDGEKRMRLGDAARRFVRGERTVASAAAIIGAALSSITPSPREPIP